MPALAEHWLLDPAITYLNHGSFGACPIPVLAVQTELRAEMEREPVAFLSRGLEGKLDAARAELAAFVGADADDLAFVPNATAGVNTVLGSLPLRSGDELLTTQHAYNACRTALDYRANRAGAVVKVAQVPFPVGAPAEVTEAVLAAVTPRTVLALIDHVTSPTAMVWPVAEMVRRLAERGVDALVDGAHAPGMVPLDVAALGAAYYTGNCHKWMCAPKGAAFLHVRRDRQPRIRPLSISHGANSPRTDRSRFRLEFDWMGTLDPTACLSVPAALRFMGGLLPGGWEELRATNRARVLEARRVLADVLDVPPPCPDDMVGAMAALPLPDGTGLVLPHEDSLQSALFTHDRIEVPVGVWPAPPHRLLRVSAQAYNRPEQYEVLARALREHLRDAV